MSNRISSTSDARRPARDWRLYISDMIEFCERIVSYTDGLDLESFEADRRTYDATMRNIELIGEAANQLPRRVWEAYPDIPWRGVVGMRNRVLHDYMGARSQTIWNALRNDVPALLDALRAIPLDDPGTESA